MMRHAFVFAVLFAIAFGLPQKNHPEKMPAVTMKDWKTPAIDPTIIASVNNAHTSWTAAMNPRFEGKTLADAKRLQGFVPNPANKEKYPTVTKVLDNLPTSYDASQQYPNCSTIGTIYNQAECGSCWAFGCIESASDRLCIQGKKNELLSFMDMVCCGPDDGCEGGDPMDAYNYVVSPGVVSAACSPYTIPTCPPAQQPCLNFVPTPPCVQTCNDTENWSDSIVQFATAYYVGESSEGEGAEGAIMTEIITNGPVEACFTVYADFLSYKSGVYQYQNGSALGGHCVKMIGWGVDSSSNLPYWLCNNSWTTYWGDNGQFKILRGQDECGIEDDVVAGMYTSSKRM